MPAAALHREDISEGDERAFEYPILSNYPVEVMEVNIQEPLRSADSSIIF